MDSLNRYAEKYEDTPLSGGIERILQTITKLQGKPVKDRTKEETKDLEQLRKWIENVKDDGRFDNLVKAATAALDNMDAALAAEKKRKEAEAKAKTLEERSRKLADLDGQMDRKSKDALTLDDWMIKERGRLTGRMGELGRTDVSGRLPEVERWCARYCLTRATAAREFPAVNPANSPGCCSSWKPFPPVIALRNWKRPCP